MSLAIRIGNRGGSSSALFYLNAVTRYERSYRSQVSKYPLDAGVSITDHTVNENPVFTISGLISPADISLRASNTVVIDGQSRDTPLNVDKNFSNSADAKVENLLGNLKKYIPDVATQFLGTTTSKAEGGILANDSSEAILEAVRKLFTRLIYNKSNDTYRNSVVFCTLYELGEASNFKNSHRNLILTDFRGAYDTENGNALVVDITFEQVRTVTLQSTTIPRNVSKSISEEVSLQAQETKDKGVEQSTLKDLTQNFTNLGRAGVLP